MPFLDIIELLAFLWFLFCWSAYIYIVNRKSRKSRSLMQSTHAYREQWMRRMLERENRIVDSTLIGNLMRSVAFFASTTIIIIGGLIALLGATDQAMSIMAQLPFTRDTSRMVWELKVLLLIVVFVYAFFKFTWSLRQFNYCNILIGSAPVVFVKTEDREMYACQAARLNSMAGNNFNYGLRAYYFGLAVLTWFLTPWLFIVASAWVVVVLYRREFCSRTLSTLAFCGNLEEKEPHR